MGCRGGSRLPRPRRLSRHRDRALTRFAKGDSFIAEGYVRDFQFERDGEVVNREEFVAKKITTPTRTEQYAKSLPLVEIVVAAAAGE